jgi:ribokinase
MIPGGHAANCAAALSKLGVHTWIACALGNDQEGRLLLEDLAQHHIHTDFVAQVDQSTGRVIIPKSPLKRSLFLFRGANESIDIMKTIKKIDFEMFDCVIVFDPLFEVVDFLISSNLKSRVLCVWNPGGILTKTTSILKRLFFPHTLIFNQVEYDSVSKMTSFQKIMKPLLEEDDPLKLIVTRGSAGSSFYSHVEARFDAFDMASIDPTGAGDAFTAGYSSMEMLGQKMEVCMRFGNLLGGLATRKVGARSSLPDFSEIQAWRDQIYDTKEI